MTTAQQAQRPLIPSGILGMGIVIATELMLFAGFLSAYLVARAGAGVWPPLGQPRLPIEATALNTLILLVSGVTMWLGSHALDQQKARRLLLVTLALGAIFVLLQGYEWVNLLGYGLSATSSLYGSYFYLLVGAHALHAIVGLVFLGWFVYGRLSRGGVGALRALGLYWYFVVALWPVLYVLVYLI